MRAVRKSGHRAIGSSVRRVVRVGGLFAFLFGSQEREENNVANGVGVGEEHGHAIDANANAPGGWEPKRQRANVVLVHLMGFFVAALAFAQLLFEAAALLHGIVKLAEAIGDFHLTGENFPALRPVGLVGLV